MMLARRSEIRNKGRNRYQLLGIRGIWFFVVITQGEWSQGRS